MDIRADQPQQLICPEQRGSTLGLCLTDASNSIWDFTVEAGTGPCFAVVGRFRNTPPSPGSGSTRWLAWIHAPGVTAWRVHIKPFAHVIGSEASASVDVSEQAITIGVNPNGGFAVVIP